MRAERLWKAVAPRKGLEATACNEHASRRDGLRCSCSCRRGYLQNGPLKAAEALLPIVARKACLSHFKSFRRLQEKKVTALYGQITSRTFMRFRIYTLLCSTNGPEKVSMVVLQASVLLSSFKAWESKSDSLRKVIARDRLSSCLYEERMLILYSDAETWKGCMLNERAWDSVG